MTAYPAALDTPTNPLPTDPPIGHAAQHAAANDAIVALQRKVGVDNSTDPTSIDHQLGALNTADPLAYYILAKA